MDDATYPRTARVVIPDTSTVRSRDCQVIAALQVRPEPSAVAEQLAESYCHLRRHWLLLVENIVQRLPRYPQRGRHGRFAGGRDRAESGAGSTPASVGRQESLQGCLAVQGKVTQSRGRVVPPAAVQDQRQHEVVAGGAVGRRQVAARQAGVLVEGLVMALMDYPEAPPGR